MLLYYRFVVLICALLGYKKDIKGHLSWTVWMEFAFIRWYSFYFNYSQGSELSFHHWVCHCDTWHMVHQNTTLPVVIDTLLPAHDDFFSWNMPLLIMECYCCAPLKVLRPCTQLTALTDFSPNTSSCGFICTAWGWQMTLKEGCQTLHCFSWCIWYFCIINV